jgi:hypothetical protein
MKNSTRSFTEVILQLFSFIFLTTGILLLIFTEDISLITLKGISAKISIVIQQFLGNAYLLLGIILYLIKGFKGRTSHLILTSLFIMGFINLYLIFQFHSLIILPAIYFVFQLSLQLLLLFALIYEVKNK